MSRARALLRSRPAVYDRYCRIKRGLFGVEAPSFTALSAFSRARGGRVNFVQIGANDGLRNDPVRPLIVRDDWQGVLVEPLPTVFPLLKRNYAYLRRPGLVFLNAAVTAGPADALRFWSFTETFLAGCTLEERLDYLRKASFERDHVAGFLPPDADPDTVLVAADEPSLTLAEVVDRHLPRSPLNLLVIDAEGYEGTLIPALDFDAVPCEAVSFEQEHLEGPVRDRVFAHLQSHGFGISLVGLDALAER
jgi:hypothetical protein